MPSVAPQSLSDRFETNAGVGRGLPEFARTVGVDIEPVASALGVDCADFRRLGARISLDRFCRLLETLATLSNDETFGLSFARRYELGGTGSFGYGLMSAPNLASAVDFVARFKSMSADTAHFKLERGDGFVRYVWGYSPLITRLDQFIDLAIALFVRHFQLSAGATWLPIAAELQRRAPRSKGPYRKFISHQITFDADQNTLTIDAAALKRPNPHADPLLFEMMSSHCADIVASRPQRHDFQRSVEEEILSTLGQSAPVAARIAALLGLSERTLQRRLAENGVGFQALVDKVRRELSDRLLIDEGLSIAEVAYRLGFSAPSAYTRSAMRWYGAAPSEMRRRMQSSLERLSE